MDHQIEGLIRNFVDQLESTMRQEIARELAAQILSHVGSQAGATTGGVEGDIMRVILASPGGATWREIRRAVPKAEGKDLRKIVRTGVVRKRGLASGTRYISSR
jgi:hypothetical protein